ncbi:GvpL/GvpF family gas vesicle protein [Streptomyces sp. AK02-01A]|uniref:GvpL/GvpF family gas vesicle protein n=1 Tax=Streptomyces sp. AK02-01A TaxID=3028648 RepID=UPI0029B419B1|nr:GvpL/GvpF family gas vesicle protein [Streptomyces sp. AK02-01A]MDX3850962.1 GvpL/GvpF family gas vesicle protein [Streptomyces sp. AK02-01A]
MSAGGAYPSRAYQDGACDDGVYVYAIVPAEQPVPAGISGVGGPPMPVRVLVEGPVAAVVSEAPPRLRARRRDLLAHQELLLRLSESGPVLPMRFGMVAPDEATVREQLAAAGVRHLKALERLVDRVELNLKALPPSDALAGLVREDETIQQLLRAARRHPGYEANLRLGEAVVTALSRRAAEAGRRAVLELTPLACAVAAGPEVSGCVLNTSFLVDRAASDRFRTAARDFAALRRDHVELRVAGPLPCYSFVAPEGPGPLVSTGA